MCVCARNLSLSFFWKGGHDVCLCLQKKKKKSHTIENMFDIFTVCVCVCVEFSQINCLEFSKFHCTNGSQIIRILFIAQKTQHTYLDEIIENYWASEQCRRVVVS